MIYFYLVLFILYVESTIYLHLFVNESEFSLTDIQKKQFMEFFKLRTNQEYVEFMNKPAGLLSGGQKQKLAWVMVTGLRIKGVSK